MARAGHSASVSPWAVVQLRSSFASQLVVRQVLAWAGESHRRPRPDSEAFRAQRRETVRNFLTGCTIRWSSLPVQGFRTRPALQRTERRSDTEACIRSCLHVSDQDAKQLTALLAGHSDHASTSQWLPKFVELLAGLGLSHKECTSSAVNLLTCNLRIRRTTIEELTETMRFLQGQLQSPAPI